MYGSRDRPYEQEFAGKNDSIILIIFEIVRLVRSGLSLESHNCPGARSCHKTSCAARVWAIIPFILFEFIYCQLNDKD